MGFGQPIYPLPKLPPPDRSGGYLGRAELPESDGAGGGVGAGVSAGAGPSPPGLIPRMIGAGGCIPASAPGLFDEDLSDIPNSELTCQQLRSSDGSDALESVVQRPAWPKCWSHEGEGGVVDDSVPGAMG